MTEDADYDLYGTEPAKTPTLIKSGGYCTVGTSYEKIISLGLFDDLASCTYAC